MALRPVATALLPPVNPGLPEQEIRLRRAVNWAVANSAHAARLIGSPLSLEWGFNGLQRDTPGNPVRLRVWFTRATLEIAWIDGPHSMGTVTVSLPNWMLTLPEADRDRQRRTA